MHFLLPIISFPFPVDPAISPPMSLPLNPSLPPTHPQHPSCLFLLFLLTVFLTSSVNVHPPPAPRFSYIPPSLSLLVPCLSLPLLLLLPPPPFSFSPPPPSPSPPSSPPPPPAHRSPTGNSPPHIRLHVLIAFFPALRLIPTSLRTKYIRYFSSLPAVGTEQCF
ncbi:hypothetical protein Pcinc_034073 [Petrolisthes cinctipes]|uniref:Uncharacterized protein n=1 Tax=Petrolisthes cinctipes TaxID=88211 RepID=A0AAE1K028_PETCI|nr:hypothetical protein Pcinc_034073 [Petrolisthes cinctipes]